MNPYAKVPVATLLLSFVLACSNHHVDEDFSSHYWFENQAEARGLDFTHVSGAVGKFELPEITGGGVALLDVENDGDLDVYFIQSGHLHKPSDESAKNELFLNDGTGHFAPAIIKDGYDVLGYGMGVATGDYDNDGDTDLYITNVGQNILLQNDGEGNFVDVTEEANVGDESWGTAASFADFDRDGDLDLYLVNYLRWNVATKLDCHVTMIESYCVPLHDYAAMDRLFENKGNGTFEDVTRKAGLSAAFGNGLGAVVVDVNNDGWLDVLVANDSMVNQLWINQKNLLFKNDAWFWGVAMDDHGIEKAGMGITTFDYDGDADFDAMVVNIQAQTDSFYRNEGAYFTDVTGMVGLATHSRRFTRFGLVAADFDNDGCTDLFQANGAVYHSEEDLQKPDYFSEPNTLYQGLCEMGFELVLPEGGTASLLEHTSRGAAVGDLDNDGFLDMVVVNKDGPAYLLMNVTGRHSHGSYVRIRVLDKNGRDAYNARLAAVAGDRHLFLRVQTDGSYLSAHDPHIHIGMGDEEKLSDVLVTWLDGSIEEFGDLRSGNSYTLHQNSKTIR